MNAQTETTFAFASGYGQSDTHAVTLSDGRPNPSKSAGQPYDLIDGKQIVAMVKNPPSVPKEQARWFIPSAYHGADARNHEAQRTNGQFSWLPGDIDKNNLGLDDVLKAVHEVLPNVSCMIYSSRSAKADKKKWRVLVPIGSMISGADYTDTTTAFYDMLETASEGILIPDRALCRPGQLVYLPNKGAFYEYRIHKGDLLTLPPGHPIIRLREENRAKIAAAQIFARKERARRANRPTDSGSDVKPVDHFNQNHTVADLLARYGYRQAGQSHDWRSPMQTSGSYATRDFGEYWISLSASDAAADIGAGTPDGYRFGDAFDLYAYFEKGGDFGLAVKDYAEEAGLNRKAAPKPKTPQPQPQPEQTEDAAPEEQSDDGEGDGYVWPFAVSKKGVWKRIDKLDKDTGVIVSKWMLICSELHVLAETRDADGEEWGRLLEVVDRDNRRKRWAMPMSLLSGDGTAVRERLFSLGLLPAQGAAARQALLEYITTAEPEEKVRCVARIGWAGGAFVLPNQTIGTF